MYFPDKGCVRTLHTLYVYDVYATEPNPNPIHQDVDPNERHTLRIPTTWQRAVLCSVRRLSCCPLIAYWRCSARTEYNNNNNNNTKLIYIAPYSISCRYTVVMPDYSRHWSLSSRKSELGNRVAIQLLKCHYYAIIFTCILADRVILLYQYPLYVYQYCMLK